MAINLFRGGYTPAGSIGADCNCGPFPSQYPVGNRVAAHMRDQRFTLAASLNPTLHDNVRCVLCDLAGTTEAQTANVLNENIALMVIPPKHLFTGLRMVLDPGNGAGAAFTVYARRVNQATGVAGAAVTLPAEAEGNTLAAARDEFYALTTAAWSGDDAIEVGVVFTAAPTAGTLCTWTGSITLVAKVDGFDYGNN
jgi:hypothetical protein